MNTHHQLNEATKEAIRLLKSGQKEKEILLIIQSHYVLNDNEYAKLLQHIKDHINIEITKYEYIRLIQDHDEYYMMSDDNRVYLQGFEEENKIRKFSEVYPNEYKKYYLRNHNA